MRTAGRFRNVVEAAIGRRAPGVASAQECLHLLGLVFGLDGHLGNGEWPVRCDFYVLDDLPVDVVLSSDFLFQLDLFSLRYGVFFVNPGPAAVAAAFCGITQLPSYRSLFAKLAAKKQAAGAARGTVEDWTSPLAFTPTMVLRELERREQTDAAIGRVTDPARAGALRQAEARRRKEWDGWRDHHRTAWASSSHQPLGRVSDGTPRGGGNWGDPAGSMATPSISARSRQSSDRGSGVTAAIPVVTVLPASGLGLAPAAG
ncbi:hypothetical protein MAPG_08076 [Magnaporthiopsis poae ATCC 64411]|uniref:Uncharacterized protein n=1 Tax=Magnaporthiopsis poae (strain ATCC 64411 / 73-15) TaxID=644358 RepID=A0A0C4E6E2_MAGP6|nr:hypothetical protein MAPG_08076 [Magnaporthiopsis poae ATCC 64411]